ncbi:MAG: transcription antitermination factor NusB, partial [Solirubrobacterales bacterium]
LYQREVTGTPLEEMIERGPFPEGQEVEQEAPVAGPLTDFARDLVRGVEEHSAELDAVIGRAAQDWSVDRIAPLERSILRTALYEILHRPDVPDEVAIDEAVEATKTFCGTEAPGFVNGVLGGVLRGLDRERVGGPGGERG